MATTNRTWSNSVWIILAIVVLGALVLWYAAYDDGSVVDTAPAPTVAPATPPAATDTTPPPAGDTTAPATPAPTTTPGTAQ